MKDKIKAFYAQYDAEVEKLMSELASYNDAQLNQKPADGGWSALQTMHHLILVEENSLAYVRKKMSFNPQFEKPGPRAWFRNVLLLVSMWSPIKFKAPKSAGAELIPSTSSLAETRDKWHTIRQEWKLFFENIPAELSEKAVYKHPRAGRISWLQMVRFFRAHFKRHRLQALRAVS
jgi:hypothetical protein